MRWRRRSTAHIQPGMRVGHLLGGGPSGDQATVKLTECQPVAPSGTGSAHRSVCTAPVLSVARTVISCEPLAAACHGKLHSRHASLEYAAPKCACCHGPLSIRTSTAFTPR